MIVGNSASQNPSATTARWAIAGVEARSSTTEIRLGAGRQPADRPRQVQSRRRAFGRQPHQFGRMQCAAAQLRDLVGGRHRPQHRERRPAAGIGGEAHGQALREADVEQARSDERVRGRAMHRRGADLGQPVDLAWPQMDRVAVETAGAQQPVRLVGVEIVPSARIQRAHPGDLVGLLAEVGLHQAVRMLGPERAQRLELRLGRGRREPGRDRVTPRARACASGRSAAWRHRRRPRRCPAGPRARCRGPCRSCRRRPASPAPRPPRRRRRPRSRGSCKSSPASSSRAPAQGRATGRRSRRHRPGRKSASPRERCRSRASRSAACPTRR